MCKGISSSLQACVHDEGLERMSSGVYKFRAGDMQSLGDGGSNPWLGVHKKDSNFLSGSRRSRNLSVEIIYEEKSVNQ